MVPSESDHSRVRVDPFLRWLALDSALAATPWPIHVIVEKLARVLDVEYVFVGQRLDVVPETVRTVAWWKDGRLAENVEYGVAGSPCEPAVGGLPTYCRSRVTEVFPKTDFQASEGIQAYAAHPLTALDGRRLGLVGIMSRRPFTRERRIRGLLADCALRVAGELEWLQREVVVPQGRALLDAASFERREQDLLEQVRERETLLREMHHRVKSNLQVVASLLTMQAGATTDQFVIRALSKAVTRISMIALVHAHLSESPNLASVDMKVFVQELVRNLQLTLAEPSRHVAIRLVLGRLTLPLSLAIPSGLLINELVTNAFQHAFLHAGSGLVEIRMRADERVVTIVVRDDGPGLPLQAEGREGLGLQLVRLLATKQLRGNVSITKRHGTECTIQFPRGTNV
jgi:two-component sensor histidine kinase